MNKVFHIDENIYSQDIIQETLNTFQEYGEIKYNTGNIEIHGENQEDIQEIFDEFCNYMLFINN